MNAIFYRLSILLIISIVYFSCRTDHLLSPNIDNPLDEVILSKAKTWYRESSSMPASDNPNDINLKEYIPDWDNFKISHNSVGAKVITIPLNKVKSTSKVIAYYSEIGLVLNKAGVACGMIKEYVGNPYAGETRLNLYSKDGHLFDQGLYDSTTRTFISAVKRRSNTPNSQ
ncbi:hypothetical protein [Pedobacter paludis]|uniref:Uncharacterized protein n=1 Tax=Pedobacter paludis TaxID=2203212 RepID=A0A317F2S4_9SPHI|nr:hypothetical protein [Pedobacter paludis]PWS31788.1 hypothetical protein DF947_08285 [Pedobacter paludis]